MASTLLAGLAFGVSAFSLQFNVQTTLYCGHHDSILTQLYLKYQEAPQYMGLTDSGNVIEFLISESGSWTIITTSPVGITCVVQAGENWQSLDVKPGENS